MNLTAEAQLQKIGQTRGISDHDHDLIHDLSKRLDAIWRYDQYILNAADKPEIQKYWQDQKAHDSEAVARAKELLAHEVHKGCF